MEWIFWMGLFLMTGAWVYLLPFYLPSSETGYTLLVGGVFSMVLACRDVTLDGVRRRHYLLIVPALCSAFLLPGPYRIPGLLVALAVITIAFGARFSYLWPLSAGFALAGAVSLFQVGGALAFRFLAPRMHDAGFVSSPGSFLLSRLGMQVSHGGGSIYITSIEGSYTLTPGWEHLGLLVLLLMVCGASAVFIFRMARTKYLPAFLGLTAAYVFLRFVLVILLYLQTGDMNIHYDRSYVVLTFLPLFVLLSLLVPLKSGGVTRVRSGLTSARWIGAFGAVGLAGACLVGAMFYQDPGSRKGGRLIIDEFHSDWEWTDREYNTEWYGTDSGYNYYDLFQYLGYFYSVERGEEPTSRESLSRCDVLVIKTPTEPFSESERDAILEFIRNGGGLVLIGDHTNVFGSSTILNTISDPVGIHFVHDCTYEIVTGGLSLYDHPELFPHPAVSHLPTFLFATSCTMTGSLAADGVILGYGLRALPADYSQVSFFPERGPRSDFRFGSFYQAMAARYGKGRVIGFSDSTVFSNFFMFMPGKPELALGLVEWANRTQRLNWLRYLFLAGFVVLLGIAVLLLGRETAGSSAAKGICAISALLFLLPPAALGLSALNVSSSTLPKAVRSVPLIAFEAEHSRFFIPRYRLAQEGDVDFDTFYVWAQRKGLVPTVADHIEDALEKAQITVIINPASEFSRQEKDAVKEYVAAGGRLLVLDDAENKDSSANQILAPFGMEMGFPEDESGSAEDSTAVPHATEIDDGAGTVLGGETILTSRSGWPILSKKVWEKGLVVAFSNSHVFERKVLGPVSTVPSPSQEALYKTIYDIYDLLIPDDYIVHGARSQRPPTTGSQQ
jgi:flavodoxin